MTTIPFDTLQFAADLIQGGFSEAQATAMTKAVTKVQQDSLATVIDKVKHDYQLDDVATKRDIRELELKIELVKSELKRDIAETKADLIRWVVGVGLLQITIIAGLLLKIAGTI